MIKHIVFWNFESEAIIKEVKEKLEALPTTIKEIVELEVGVNFNESDAAFDVALYTSFNSKEELNSYQVHPAHKEVAQFISSVATQRAVVDYEV